MAVVGLPSNYGLVVLVAASTPFIYVWMGFGVSKARKRYDVHYPELYADPSNKNAKAFNCVQRGHQQALEYVAHFYMLLLLGGLQHPLLASLFGALFLVGRVLFFIGYSSGDPAKRQRGVFYYFALMGLVICNISLAVQLLATGDMPWKKSTFSAQ